jgi:hypothetical protein
MKTHWLESTLAYDGSQLRPHWIRGATGIVGDATVAFRGPCRVRAAEMADVADVLAGSTIAGDDMVHFIAEVFDDGDLPRALLRQRLLSAMAAEQLRELAPGIALQREGDDLFADGRKLSISVATRSLVSTLIHFAVNVTTTGTPVPTAGLLDLRVDPREFAGRLLDAVAREEESMAAARCQVRGREGSHRA